jgi:aryl-alcohol dehydrogenase-like predicted oxidoreductase
MEHIRLGQSGPSVAALGLGCMGMSDVYGPADEAESLATLHAAVDAGITLLDTGDFYGMGHNELLIRELLRQIPRNQVVISVKFGAQRGPDRTWQGYDARPAAVKTWLAYSLRRLGTDYIDIYRPARRDVHVPYEDTIGAIKDLIQAGYVRHVGLSEVSSASIRTAAAVHPIADLQIEYSLFSRDIEASILPTCRELGIAVTAYGVLSRGLLSGHWRAGVQDPRLRFPRYQQGNVEANLALVEALRDIGGELGATVAQLAFAWVRAKGDDILPLVGARTRTRLAEALPAADLHLNPAQIARIEAAIPPEAVQGARYDDHAMRDLDSNAG